MSTSSKLTQLYLKAKNNKWLHYFTIFNRISLAAGFLPSGFVKIMGERFTALSNNHPMGHYLEALHTTGYYYTFIGIVQVTAAILLLIPRTALLGALLYFPIIFNICILSLSVRFEGSLISSPLMLLANLYLLCWNYDQLKYIFSSGKVREVCVINNNTNQHKFAAKFFACVLITVAMVVLATNLYEIMPRNTLTDCDKQCEVSTNPQACRNFCACIHTNGQPINKCLDEYNKALKYKGK